MTGLALRTTGSLRYAWAAGACYRSRAMGSSVLAAFVALAVLAGTAAPCPPERVATRSGAPVAASLQAPCPCGCDEHGPGAPQSRVGFALLVMAPRLPSFTAARPGSPAPPSLPQAPVRAIEKVPRAARAV